VTRGQKPADRTPDAAGRRSARRWARACAVLLLAGLAAAHGCARSDGGRETVPDVVLVVVDALRADRVRRAIESGGAALPHLVRLAEDGVVYERASSPATWCVPAHASLLTGRWPSFHGAERRLRNGELVVQPLDAEAVTLAEILATHGLRTAAFLPGRADVAAAQGFDRGFADFVNDPALAVPSHMADAVAHWLDAQSGPVFLFVSLDTLREASVPGDGGEIQRIARADVTNAVGRSGVLSPEKRDEIVTEYDSGLGAVDQALGELLAALQADGRYAGALIVVTADHGELLGEHGLAGSGWPPFEGTLNVPLIVKYPQGRDAGTHVDRRVSTLGVFATAVEAAGARLPADVQARPLDDHHPVWAEDVDRRGQRVRAGYDGLSKKIIRVTSGDVDVACMYDMYVDWAELNPDCGSSDHEPLSRAMASFSKRPRPGEPASGFAQAGDGASGAGRRRATN